MRRATTAKTVILDIIEGNLHELFENYQTSDGWREENIAQAFAGKLKKVNPSFRIPAADTKTEIFFDDLEVLSRFANMPLPDQEVFCERVRATMKETGLNTLHLTIKWSETETKVLKIRLVANHHLDVFLG